MNYFHNIYLTRVKCSTVFTERHLIATNFSVTSDLWRAKLLQPIIKYIRASKTSEASVRPALPHLQQEPSTVFLRPRSTDSSSPPGTVSPSRHQPLREILKASYSSAWSRVTAIIKPGQLGASRLLNNRFCPQGTDTMDRCRCDTRSQTQRIDRRTLYPN